MIPRKNLIRAMRKSFSQPIYAYRNFTHRFKSALSYHLFDGKSYWPETISLFLTYKCNLRCLMCGQWGENGAFNEFSNDLLKQRLSLDEIKPIIDNVRFFQPNITLFGGEPMLHPEWLKIVKAVKTAGMRCNIVTNGTLIQNYAEEIIDSGLDEIIFSLDGPEEIHDKIRRVPGTFQRSIEGFEILHDLKQKRKIKTPIININSTLWEENYKSINDTINIAENIHARGLTFHHLLFLSKPTVRQFFDFFEKRFDQTPTDWIGFTRDNPPKIDVDFLTSKIEEIQRKKSVIDISFFPNFNSNEIRRWYSEFEFESSSYKNRCLSLWMTAYILPDGSVRPYHSMNFTTGNVLEHPFTEIWNNDLYRGYRNHIKRHKRFSICSKGCTEFYRY
ncbi:MAG: radical SAM protein [Candidatus Marinimicrobia bacterium]|nr:radical SAM protein [bacterium]MCG2715437.1 radical SAM protein [Candidatus Neomarinimicrobiota bacterium]